MLQPGWRKGAGVLAGGCYKWCPRLPVAGQSAQSRWLCDAVRQPSLQICSGVVGWEGGRVSVCLQV